MGKPDFDGVNIVQVPLPKLVPDPDASDLLMEQLNVPVRTGDRKAENKRLDAVRKFFENLSPSDAQLVYSRLEDPKDPLSKKFFDKFKANNNSADLIDILDKKVQSRDVESEQVQYEKPQSPASPSSKKAEIGMGGTVRQIQLQGIFRDKDVIIDRYPEAKDIAEHQFMPPDVKKERLQKIMEKASTAEFKQLIADSNSWPDAERNIFNAAMGESEKVMKRIAQELPAKDQASVIGRTQMEWGGLPENDSGVETLEKRKKALAAWQNNTQALNEILDHVSANGSSALYGISDFADDILASPKKMNLLYKLSDENTLKVLKHSVSSGNEISDEEIQLLGNLLPGAKAAEKNAMIDLLQEKGLLEKLLAHGTMTPEHLTPRNLGVISAEYYSMAKTERDATKRKALNEQMKQLDGYAENRYNKNDYDEYIRIRDRYHR